MTGHLTTPKAHLEPEYVLGHHGQPIYAPTIAEVDRRIAELRERIAEKGHRFPRLERSWRADIDALLDRRFYLQTTNGGQEPVDTRNP